jgi:predicted TIM-barrel fold metal-dependent hydrolase
MQVIDVHAHDVKRGYYSEDFWEGYGKLVAFNRFMDGKIRGSLEEYKDDYIEHLERLCGDNLIACLDRAGVDVMVVSALEFGMDLHPPAISIEQQNADHARLAEEHPDRLKAFVGINPLRGKSALEFFERAVRRSGMRGLKLHPLAGFHANDREVYPFYEKAIELGVPVLIHLGPDQPPLRGKYGRPMDIDDVCIDFPELRLMGAHMGGCWRDEAVKLASAHPNLYLDLSGLHAEFARDPIEAYRRLRRDLDILGPHKLTFGSDHPHLGWKFDLKAWVEVFTEIPSSLADEGIAFSDREIEGILHRNATRWLTGRIDGSQPDPFATGDRRVSV